MAWTTPMTWSTGAVVTAPQLNEQVRDNENYLYNALYTLTQTKYATTTRLLSTNYQNTTSKIMFVYCSVRIDGGSPNSMAMSFGTESTSPPTSILGPKIQGSGTTDIAATVTFAVPSSYYYIVSCSFVGAHAERAWIEWLIG